MGLLKHEIFDLLLLVKEQKFKSVCMIGKQDVIADWVEIERILKDLKLNYNEQMLQELRKEMIVDSYKLFQIIGIEEVHAVDYSDYEGADIILDLNKAGIPDEYRHSFDLVIDGGTLEHIFNVPVALQNMDALVKEGGYIYHMLPLAGWVNHGFYSFSPTFFLDYYDKNNWFIKTLQIHFLNPKGVIISSDCRFLLNDGELNDYIVKNMGAGRVSIQCFVQKKEDGVMHYPIQGMYEDIYRDMYKSILSIEKLMELVSDGENIAIYGIGNVGKSLINEIINKNLENEVCIFDSNVEIINRRYKGITVQEPTQEKLSVVKKIIVSSTKFETEIIEKLLNLGVAREKIVGISELMC